VYLAATGLGVVVASILAAHYLGHLDKEMSGLLIALSAMLLAIVGMLGMKVFDVGPYTPIQRVASGSMGDIWLAKTHNRAGATRLVALRVFPRGYARHAPFVFALVRDAAVLCRLKHPNILGVFDLARIGAGYFCDHVVPMEAVDGPSLDPLLRALRKRHGGVSVELAVWIVEQAARGLAYAHERGVIHADLRPKSILVSRDGEAKVIFELTDARALLQARGALPDPAYRSPEQVAGDKVDHRTDIFNAGIILYEALTGSSPLSGGPMAQAARPASLRPDLPPELDALIMRALARDPSARFQSAGELAAALSDCLRLSVSEPFRGGRGHDPEQLRGLVRAAVPSILPPFISRMTRDEYVITTDSIVPDAPFEE